MHVWRDDVLAFSPLVHVVVFSGGLFFPRDTKGFAQKIDTRRKGSWEAHRVATSSCNCDFKIVHLNERSARGADADANHITCAIFVCVLRRSHSVELELVPWITYEYIVWLGAVCPRTHCMYSNTNRMVLEYPGTEVSGLHTSHHASAAHAAHAACRRAR